MPRLACTLTFAGPPSGGPAGTLHVRLLDVGRADAAADVLAAVDVPGVAADPAGAPVEVLLDVPDPLPRGRLALEAHLDVDGSGQTAVGDYRVMEHVGVTQDDVARGRAVPVLLRPVR